MDSLAEVYSKAREKLKGICQVCSQCNGHPCAGKVPGMGGVGTGSSFVNNFEALRDYRLIIRTIHEVNDPEISMSLSSLFGRELSMPVLSAPVAGARLNFNGTLEELELASYILKGSLDAGTMGFTGDGPDPRVFDAGIEAIKMVGGAGIPTIKPRPNPEILQRIRIAEGAGVAAVAIDIDSAGLINMTRAGARVGPKSPSQLREITESTSLPVILKGIMSPDEALLAVDAGCKGIVVSNHGGRALDHSPGTAEVLPDIAKTVKGKICIMVDGGVRSGVDVLKMLALGADLVLIGRPVAISAIGGGDRGVKLNLERMKAELSMCMIMTGTKTVRDVNPNIIKRKADF